MEFIAHKLQTRPEMKSLLKPEELWKVRAYFVNATNTEGEWITDLVDTSKASEVKVVSKAKPKPKAVLSLLAKLVRPNCHRSE